MNDTIIIIGAGPAGLTAALELQAAGKNVIIMESDKQVGGISKTVNHNGNRIDIGGHRFFSKSDWVMNWWTDILPVQADASLHGKELRYQGQSRNVPADAKQATESDDAVMLVRNRISRIYFNRNFFDYPLKLNADFFKKIGLKNTFTFGVSYVKSKVFPIKSEKSLEDFFINRFGNKLYRQFFKEYTEKVWGVPCSQISAEWGAQRVKSLSITKALWHALRSSLGISNTQAKQTSLIESFIYPKYGPGQIWEKVAEQFIASGGILKMQHRVVGINIENKKATAVIVENEDGKRSEMQCSHLISTMPVKDLIRASSDAWPQDVKETAASLEYRDFITVGLLYTQTASKYDLHDNWIYIQEPGVNVGRIQVFKNWSPYMVSDPENIWFGLEFFSKEGDELWSLTDDELKNLAQKEMIDIGIIDGKFAIDSVVIRVPKAYPGYFGESYKQFHKIRDAVDKIDNLFLVGRNGMHRYNNQDHSMLTAKEAADQIISGKTEKSKIWNINIDDDYHEEVKK